MRVLFIALFALIIVGCADSTAPVRPVCQNVASVTPPNESPVPVPPPEWVCSPL